MSKIEFYPDINEYLAEEKNNAKPNTAGLQDLVAFVQSRTGLSNAVTRIFIAKFFTEIQNALINNQTVYFGEIGYFYRTKFNSIEIKTSTKLKKKLNGKFK